MKRIICLYAGAGKTTSMLGLAYNFKKNGITAETNPEYVKDWVWEERKIRPGDQTYFFAKMARNERVYMENGVNVIVTDSPLILTHFYGLKYDPFEQKANTSLIMLKHHHEVCKHYGYKIDHYVINCNKPYDPKGRYQTEEVARSYDTEIEDMLKSVGIKYQKVSGDGADEVITTILKNYEL
jgi:hypothetical protein